MKNTTLSILLVLLLLAVVSRVGAQSVSKSGFQPKMLVYENFSNDTILRHFRERFRVMDNLVKHPLTQPFDDFVATRHFARPELPSDSLYKKKTELETMALNRRNGLEVTGQVYGRLDDALNNVITMDDDESHSSYKAKVQGEIGWNWINSSVFQNKRKKQAIVLDNKIAQAQKADDGSDAYDLWSDTLTQRWNHVLAAVMLCHVHNLDVLNEAYQLMIENDRITSGDLLEVMNDKMELEFDLAQIYAKDDLPPHEQLAWIEPEDVVLDTLELRQEIAANNPQSRLRQLQIDKLDNDMHLGGWFSTVRLTPFVRWSTYLDSHDKFSHNADAGIRFTIPLYSDTKRKRQAMAVEKDILRDEGSDYTDKVMARCLQTIDRVRRLNKSIAVEYDHLKQLRKYLEMRQKVYAANQGRYSYIGRLQEYNEYCKSMERLYKQMRDRSLALVTLQKTALLPDLNTVVKTKLLK